MFYVKAGVWGRREIEAILDISYSAIMWGLGVKVK
jgi:hypothetical protein